MKKLLLIFTLLVFTSLLSCKKTNNEVIFVNDSKGQIDSVFVFGNQKCNPLILKNIMSDESANGNLENCNIESGDGSYGIEIYYNSKVIKKGFGYYTNGWMDFGKIEIIIKEDESILINQR